MNQRQQRAAARRMIHRSRSVAVTAALTIVAVVAVWLGTEAVLAAVGHSPLLLAPADLWRGLLAQMWIAGVVAAVLAVLGVVLLVLAVAPGGRGRRVLVDDRIVIIVDDTVLAGALSRSAAAAAHVPASQVTTALGRRAARTTISPLSGFPVPRDRVVAAVDAAVGDARPAEPVASIVDVAQRGVLA